MRLLDLFCGAGGASAGYHRAGFTEIWGVDLSPQPRYPFWFIHHDAIQWLYGIMPSLRDDKTFDLIHASPPCQRYSVATKRWERRSDEHADLVGPVRELLQETGIPYVIENVPGSPLVDPVKLRGTHFELGATCDDGLYRQLLRERWFECSWPCPEPIIEQDDGKQKLGIYGHGGHVPQQRGYSANKRERSEALDIDWMLSREMSQAIPPAYTAFIGRAFIAQTSRVRKEDVIPV